MHSSYSINEMCDPPLADDDGDENESNVNDDPELSLQDDGKEVTDYTMNFLS